MPSIHQLLVEGTPGELPKWYYLPDKKLVRDHQGELLIFEAQIVDRTGPRSQGGGSWVRKRAQKSKLLESCPFGKGPGEVEAPAAALVECAQMCGLHLTGWDPAPWGGAHPGLGAGGAGELSWPGS